MGVNSKGNEFERVFGMVSVKRELQIAYLFDPHSLLIDKAKGGIALFIYGG